MYDYADTLVPMLARMYKKRTAGYSSLGGRAHVANQRSLCDERRRCQGEGGLKGFLLLWKDSITNRAAKAGSASEYELKRTLHLARASQHLSVVAESLGMREAGVDVRRIKVGRVGQVEDVPMEEQADSFAQLNGFGQADIRAEVIVGTKLVPLASLAGSRVTEELDGEVRIGKSIGDRLSAPSVSRGVNGLC